MPARFRIYDNGGKTADRFTIIDTFDEEGEYILLGFNGIPYHPQHGIALTGGIDRAAYCKHVAKRFRTLGKRLPGNKLPKAARQLVVRFMLNCCGNDAQIGTAMGWTT